MLETLVHMLHYTDNFILITFSQIIINLFGFLHTIFIYQLFTATKIKENSRK